MSETDKDVVPPKHRHHEFDYVEIAVKNMIAAKAFYSQAFDWSFNDYGEQYAGIQRPSGGTSDEIGGLQLLTSDQNDDGVDLQRLPKFGPLMILYSQNLDETLVRVRAAPAGQVMVEPFAFPGGRRFHFRDPSGNEMAVWSQN